MQVSVGTQSRGSTVGSPASAPADQPIHSIILPDIPADFPAGPGRRTFMVRCSICHSLRYVTMQPQLSKEAWEKIVQKMIKTYGAHITEAEAKDILAYLDHIGRP